MKHSTAIYSGTANLHGSIIVQHNEQPVFIIPGHKQVTTLT